MSRIDSFSGTANARLLDAGRVGSSFVYSHSFGKVAAADHNSILGPRGSGKTTLLKMLMLPALATWSHARRDEILRGLEFVAAYIPATITWSADYRAFNSHHLDEQAAQLLSVSLFRHSVMSSLANLIEERRSLSISADPSLRRFADHTNAAEHSVLIRDVGLAWGLAIEVSTAQGLMSAIRRRVREIQQVLVEASIKGLTGSDIFDRLSFVSANFLDDVDDFVAIFGDSLNGLKLSLCFDELEIASPEVSDIVLRAPRSINQKVLIKYSAAPYVSAAPEVKGPAAPSSDNDYKLVYLSSFSAHTTKEFTSSLFRSMANDAGVDATPSDVLGSSFITGSVDESDSETYGYQGTRQAKFQSLYRKDATFQAYIDQRSIDIRRLDAGSENSRAADIRKIIWPVLVREEFLFAGDGAGVGQRNQRRLRSKKPISDIYTGAGSLFAICEGNPRWIIGLLKPMISSHHIRHGKSVKRSDQKAALERMSAAYFALLSTIPSVSSSGGPSSLLELIDIIGIFFQRSILGPDFNPDPVLSFQVDNRNPTSILDLVGRGLNVGALVSSPRVTMGHSYHPGEIVGLKVRLTNLLAPYYKLPLIGGRTLPLSTILARQSKISPLSTLGDLFGDKL